MRWWHIVYEIPRKAAKGWVEVQLESEDRLTRSQLTSIRQDLSEEFGIDDYSQVHITFFAEVLA